MISLGLELLVSHLKITVFDFVSLGVDGHTKETSGLLFVSKYLIVAGFTSS